MIPYYDDGARIIYHADNRDVLPDLANIDLVFTSPPYNLGTSTGGGFNDRSPAAKDFQDAYRSYDDALPADEYERWQTEVVSACWKTLSDDGAIFYNHKPRIQNGIAKLPTDYGPTLPLRQIIVWNRQTGLNFSRSFFLPKSEWIVVWAKPEWRLAERSACEAGDVWTIPPETNDRHPAAFPLALPTLAISSTTAETVLDPFAGVGTTLRAAKDLGRRAVGIELDERYCEIAARRLDQEVLPLS